MRRGFLGILVLVLAGVVAPARADATYYGSTSGINGVLYDDCLQYPYRYAVAPPPETQDWQLDVVLFGPDGRQAETDRVSTDALSGTSTFLLCPPADRYGRYTIRSTFEWLGTDSSWRSARLADTYFSLRKPYTRTRLSVSTRHPAYGQRVAYRIRALDERPTGYLPAAFTWVHLEKRRSGHWVRVKGSRAMTHDNGRVKVRLRYLGHHHRMRMRAVTERTGKLTRSVSPVVRLW